MPKRTIREARSILEEDLAPGLNDYHLKRFRQSLTEAEGAARKAADEFMTRHEEHVKAARQEALKEVCDVRDELEALAAEGETGRVTGQDYAGRYTALTDRQAKAEKRLDEVGQLISAVAEVEEDPVAWADTNLYQRYPELRPEFEF